MKIKSCPCCGSTKLKPNWTTEESSISTGFIEAGEFVEETQTYEIEVDVALYVCSKCNLEFSVVKK